MTDDSQQTLVILNRILELPEEQRNDALAKECGDNSELRGRVQALLSAQQDPQKMAAAFGNTFATTDAVSGTHVYSAPDDKISAAETGEYEPAEAGILIAGRYILKSKLGEGGMGEVWKAQQTKPVKRNVAIKLIKSGMDSRTIVSRFDQERQALAIMDHPNIARVLDGGVTDNGEPFFVMELVNGLQLNQYADNIKLTTRQRLELFIQICNAIQHAHYKGIVHRDLKPANILVTEVDGRAVPKVIDFGVAKAIGGSLTDDAMETQFGAVIGTLEYMAPEQAGVAENDIDTRADIYSLGVILYELLTGLRPIDSKQLKNAGLAEMIRVIKEEEPSKPSTRLSTADSLPSIAAVRQVDPRKLTSLLKGELDWVVMKCLEKSRERRYETANALASDLGRFLSDDPVEARPPSSTYRLQKFLKRNKGLVIATSIVAVTLIAGIIGTSWGLVQARAQQKIAEDETAKKEIALKAEAVRAEGERLAKLDAKSKQALAETQKTRAEEQQARAEASEEVSLKRLEQLQNSTEALVGVFRNLDPSSEEKEGLPLRTLLAKNLIDAAKSLESVDSDPVELARMQSWLGQALSSLGETDDAILILKKAWETYQENVGSDDTATLNVANELALAYRSNDRFSDAIQLLKESLKRSEMARGKQHMDTLALMNNLAITYRHSGDLKTAFPIYLEVEKTVREKLGPRERATLAATNDLALAYQDLGQLDKALELFVENLAISRKELGDNHVFTLNSINNLAKIYLSTAQHEKALPLLKEALEGRRSKLGPTHPSTLQSMTNLSLYFVDAKEPAKAIPLLEETLAGREARLGINHRGTLGTMQTLAEAYLQSGQIDRALSMLSKTLKKMQRELGDEHPDTMNLMNNLAGSYWQTGQLDKSVPMFEELFPIHQKKLGPDHPLTINVQANLGVNYRDAGRLPEAIKTLEDAVARYEKLTPLTARRLYWIPTVLTSTYERAGMFDKAEPGLQKAWEQSVEQFGEDHPNSTASATRLAGNLLEQKKFDDALSILEPTLATRQKNEPNQWSTFNTQALLGQALFGLKRNTQAESHLEKGYQGMQSMEQSIPANSKSWLIRAKKQLIEVYRANGKSEKADQLIPPPVKNDGAEKETDKAKKEM